MSETLVEKQVRLVLEQQCVELANHLKPKLPAGVGFALFIMDYGDKGNVSYVSTADREDMIRMVEDWLKRQGRIVSPVTNGVQARTLRAVAEALEGIESLIGKRNVNPTTTIRNIVRRLRADAEVLERPEEPIASAPEPKGLA